MTQSTETTGAVDELETPYELTALDRCDACGAQAYIRVVVASGELLFCAHHGRKHQEKLSQIAHSWHDESSRLLADDARLTAQRPMTNAPDTRGVRRGSCGSAQADSAAARATPASCDSLAAAAIRVDHRGSLHRRHTRGRRARR